MISYPKFGSYTPMFRIPDMIDEFRVICFIFKDVTNFRLQLSLYPTDIIAKLKSINLCLCTFKTSKSFDEHSL